MIAHSIDRRIGEEMATDSPGIGADPVPEEFLTPQQAGENAGPAHPPAWLISEPGAPVRVCCPIAADMTRIGRAPDNELVIQGPEAGTVSLHHLAIERAVVESRPVFRARDLDSTNGTFVNGERISECVIEPKTLIRMGAQGPGLSLVFEEPPSLELDRTTAIPAEVISPPAGEPVQPGNTYEHLLSEGVQRVRRARAHGLAGQTMMIMRETMDHALRRASRRFQVIIGILIVGLLGVSGYASWRIARLNLEKQAIDKHIAELEAQVQKAGSADEANRLITQLNGYEAAGEELQRDPLYRLGRRNEDPVTTEIRSLMAEFGAEAYSVPPEFTERVKYYIQQYEGPDRPLMNRALSATTSQMRMIRQVMEEQHLPADLSYMPVVESALEARSESRAGALGLWQFTPVTARAFGLRVTADADERTDTLKSTRAACRYLRSLILDFGSGSSVMLALAAYNLGPSKVKQTILKVVADPIKQRNFWYLYRVKAIPLETREYVPKVIAAMIIARDPGRFGFPGGTQQAHS